MIGFLIGTGAVLVLLYMMTQVKPKPLPPEITAITLGNTMTVIGDAAKIKTFVERTNKYGAFGTVCFEPGTTKCEFTPFAKDQSNVINIAKELGLTPMQIIK